MPRGRRCPVFHSWRAASMRAARPTGPSSRTVHGMRPAPRARRRTRGCAPRCPARARRRPASRVLPTSSSGPEELRDPRDRGGGGGQQRMTVARVADRVGEHVGELQRAVVAQQQQPGIDRAGDGGREAARAGHEVEPLGAVRARSSRRRARGPAPSAPTGCRASRRWRRCRPGRRRARSGAARPRAGRMRRRRRRRTRCRRARAPPARSPWRASGWTRSCRTCP